MSKLRDGLVMAAEGLAELIESEVKNAIKIAGPIATITTGVDVPSVIQPTAPERQKKTQNPTQAASATTTVSSTVKTEVEGADLRGQCADYIRAIAKKNRDSAVALLAEFGTTSLSKLADEKLSEFSVRAAEVAKDVLK
jgi:hypothetical protein